MNTCSDIALADVAGPMKDMLDKLSGTDGASWLEAIKLTLRTDPRLLIKRLKEGFLKLWKTLTAGGNTKDELLAKFAEAKLPSGATGIKIGDWASDIAGKTACDFPKEKEDGVEFVMGSLRDLFGFPKDTKTEVFLNEAFLAKHGLELCKPSDAFYIRLTYLDQPLDEWVRVGMKPITDSSGNPSVFRLAHNSSGMWLDALYADPDRQWDPGCVWVFRLRKIAQP